MHARRPLIDQAPRVPPDQHSTKDGRGETEIDRVRGRVKEREGWRRSDQSWCDFLFVRAAPVINDTEL